MVENETRRDWRYARITSAPTGLFGSHYAFSDTVPGKPLSSDVLFISVQASVAGGPTPAFPYPAMEEKKD